MLSFRIAHAPAARRHLRLFLLAVLLPTAVVVVVGSRSAVQDAELNRRRSEDDRRTAVANFRQRLLGRLDRIRLRHIADLENPTYGDSSIAFAARIDGDRVIPPWEDDSATVAFARDRREPRFANALAAAERASIPPIDSAKAVRAFDRAQSAAASSSQKDYAMLLASHIVSAGQREILLTDLAQHPLTHRDEFGVPFAFYATSALLHERPTSTTRRVVTDIVQRAARELLAARALSPMACLQLRAIAGEAAGAPTLRIARRCADIESAERLTAGATIAGMPPPEPNGAIWKYWNAADWLVTRSVTGSTDRLIAVRVAQVVVGEDAKWRIVPPRSIPGAVPLGDEIMNAAVVIPAGALSPVTQPSRSWLYIAALLVLATLATTSAALLWRDVRREADVAALRADFVRAVSHELKTPLTAIRMFVETLRERPHLPPHTRDEYLGTILAESERLTRLLDNVLEFSRVERDQRTYGMRPVCLEDVVTEALRIIEHATKQQGFMVDVTVGTPGIVVQGDADALKQAILNLLTNAMKYSGSDRRIALSLTEIATEARIAVADHGVGIAAPEHERIFEKFYRATSSVETGAAGAGLGLTIVKHIAQGHGGRITVESEPGRGSVFTLILPAVSAVAAPVSQITPADVVRT